MNFSFASCMGRCKILSGFLWVLFSMSSVAQMQSDSIGRLLDEVVITGTRTENRVKNLPLPIQVISARTIQQSGAENLLDLLQMQTGLVIAVNPLGISLQGFPNPFGTGVQMQGLDPAYTLILVDGEPLTGRNAGILDMGRIALNNVKQVEILRGPATSLYGSDALAGVINIITQDPVHNTLEGRLRYGSNNEQVLSVKGGLKIKKTSLEILARRYSNDGWDFSETTYGKTIDPFQNHSVNIKTITHLNDRNTLVFSGRYFNQKQFNNYMIAPESGNEIITGTTVEEDKSMYGKWQHQVNDRLNYIASVYATGFGNYSNAFLKRNDSLYEKITLSHFLLRPELQFNLGSKGNQWVAGGGYNYEFVNSNRYSATKRMDAGYAYLQKQFSFLNDFNLIAGARYDKNSLYAAQLSPKIAIAYTINTDFILKASLGRGFKAPDFRQQFLDFSNSLVGYTILGAREIGNGLKRLQRDGLLAESIDIQPYSKGVELDPERSTGVNLGFDYTLNPGMIWKLNLFRNDINHLIETYSLPFNQLNNKAIFSYINVNKVYTQGLELTWSYHLGKNFLINAGYNLLDAKDKKVIQDIKEGKIYKRDPSSGKSTLVKAKDYKGLYNRSRHTAMLSVQYTNSKLKAGAGLFVKYRGRYGFQGINNYEDGNEILDDPREFAEGFSLVNVIINKEIGSHFNIRGGVDNLLNYTQPVLMPSQFGRSYFLSVNFKL